MVTLLMMDITEVNHAVVMLGLHRADVNAVQRLLTIANKQIEGGWASQKFALFGFRSARGGRFAGNRSIFGFLPAAIKLSSRPSGAAAPRASGCGS
jgi:hypothetical protein